MGTPTQTLKYPKNFDKEVLETKVELVSNPKFPLSATLLIMVASGGDTSIPSESAILILKFDIPLTPLITKSKTLTPLIPPANMFPKLKEV